MQDGVIVGMSFIGFCAHFGLSEKELARVWHLGVHVGVKDKRSNGRRELHKENVPNLVQ